MDTTTTTSNTTPTKAEAEPTAPPTEPAADAKTPEADSSKKQKAKRYLPEHKKPDAALTFPEKVRTLTAVPPLIMTQSNQHLTILSLSFS